MAPLVDGRRGNIEGLCYLIDVAILLEEILEPYLPVGEGLDLDGLYTSVGLGCEAEPSQSGLDSFPAASQFFGDASYGSFLFEEFSDPCFLFSFPCGFPEDNFLGPGKAEVIHTFIEGLRSNTFSESGLVCRAMGLDKFFDFSGADEALICRHCWHSNLQSKKKKVIVSIRNINSCECCVYWDFLALIVKQKNNTKATTSLLRVNIG